MITLNAERQHIETFIVSFFPYIDMWKRTQINNLVGQPAQSLKYLSAVAINCILKEVQDKLRKKIINCKGHFLKIEFTDAQGVTLYQMLLNIPLSDARIHHITIVTTWIQLLDGQIITNKIYEENKIAGINAATTHYDYYE